MKDLGIVICNFNKVDYLRNCLKSIAGANFNNLLYDIIVVDNASTDGSEEMVCKEFPNVILIQTGANLGGAGGFARGMQYVLDNKYKYLSVLDNDTIVDKNAFIELKNHLDNNDDVGVVGSTILKMDEPDIIQEMGAILDYEEYCFFLNFNERIYSNDIPQVVECDYVPACCFMTRYDVLEEVGIFDETYFIYWDDIDWCTRVKKSGNKIQAISSSKVWHKGGAKLVTNTFPVYYYTRNAVRFFVKNIKNDTLEHMSRKFSEFLAQQFYFATNKNEENYVVSTIMGIDDAYANYVGANWDSIKPRERELHKFYENCKNKKVALLEYNNIYNMKSIIKNLILADTDLTVFVKDLDVKTLKGYFPSIDIKDISTYISGNFDLTIQAVKHIDTSLESYDQSRLYLDALGNYIMDDESKKSVQNFLKFKEMFIKVYKPILEIKFNRIKNDISK